MVICLNLNNFVHIIIMSINLLNTLNYLHHTIAYTKTLTPIKDVK